MHQRKVAQGCIEGGRLHNDPDRLAMVLHSPLWKRIISAHGHSGSHHFDMTYWFICGSPRTLDLLAFHLAHWLTPLVEALNVLDHLRRCTCRPGFGQVNGLAMRSCGDLASLRVVDIGCDDEIAELHFESISSTHPRHRYKARMDFMQQGSKIECCTLRSHARQPGDEDGEGFATLVLDHRVAILELVQATKRPRKRNATAGLKFVDDRVDFFIQRTENANIERSRLLSHHSSLFFTKKRVEVERLQYSRCFRRNQLKSEYAKKSKKRSAHLPYWSVSAKPPEERRQAFYSFLVTDSVENVIISVPIASLERCSHRRGSSVTLSTNLIMLVRNRSFSRVSAWICCARRVTVACKPAMI